MNNSSHTVLARKYRPTTFQDVVGQEHVKNAIKNSISTDKLHSVYLLSGTRGIGKTTIARIFAKAMNCLNYEHNHEPCGNCESCISFQMDNNPGIIEIDAASRSTVQETRNIIDVVNLPVLISKFNVFIIDEVHMLSTSSFNALLKTLEEPPESVKFILCTTDPQKIPATVLSRCLHFHLRPITSQQIFEHLCKLLTIENISYDERALYLLAKLANGSMRDSLSLTDQAIALGNNSITLKDVHAMVGMLDESNSVSLLKSLFNRDAVEALRKLDYISQEQPDWKLFISQILENLTNLTIVPLLSEKEQQEFALNNYDLFELIQENKQNNRNLIELSQILYDIFVHAIKLIDITSNSLQVMKLTVIRGLAFSSSTDFLGDLEKIFKSSAYVEVNENNTNISISTKKFSRRASRSLEFVTTVDKTGSIIDKNLLKSSKNSNAIDNNLSEVSSLFESMDSSTENVISNFVPPEVEASSLIKIETSENVSIDTNDLRPSINDEAPLLNEVSANSQNVKINVQANVIDTDLSNNAGFSSNTISHFKKVHFAVSEQKQLDLVDSSDFIETSLLPSYIADDSYKLAIDKYLNYLELNKPDYISYGYSNIITDKQTIVQNQKVKFLSNLVNLYDTFKLKIEESQIAIFFQLLDLTDEVIRFIFNSPMIIDHKDKKFYLGIEDIAIDPHSYLDNLKEKLKLKEYKLEIVSTEVATTEKGYTTLKSYFTEILDSIFSASYNSVIQQSNIISNQIHNILNTIALHE